MIVKFYVVASIVMFANYNVWV